MLNKIGNYIKKNGLVIVLLGIICVLTALNLYDLKYASSPNLKVVFITYSILIIISIISFLIFRKKNINLKNIPRLFLILCITLGGGYIFLSPLFTGSDEHNHYYRIYEITEGHFITETDNGYVGGKLPSSLKETFAIGSGNNTTIKYTNIKDMQNIELNESKKVQYGNDYTDFYENTALYSPIQYIPHTIGFLIGKQLSLNPYWIGILGRIFNLVFYALLGFLALKITPRAKMFLLMILLSPNMIQCATTLSADAFTNVIFLLLISLIFKVINQEERISKIEEGALFLLSIFIALCKIVYLPAVFLLLLISKDKFKNKRTEKYVFCIITIMVASILSMLWMNTTDKIFEIAYKPAELQKQFILHNIFEYFIVVVRTYLKYGFKYFECLAVGTTMYHGQLEIPTLFSVFYNIILLIALFNQKDKVENKKGQILYVTFVSLIIVALISTAIYLQCTAKVFSVAYPVIEGIQGRYFIPILFLIPYICNFKLFKVKNNNFYFLINIFINVSTWIYMIARFTI